MDGVTLASFEEAGLLALSCDLTDCISGTECTDVAVNYFYCLLVGFFSGGGVKGMFNWKWVISLN